MESLENVTIEEYFRSHLPKMFEEEVANKDATKMQGTHWTAQFLIENASYGLSVKDINELSITEGPIDNPMMGVEISEDAWRLAITGKLPGSEMFAGFSKVADRKVYNTLEKAQGVLNLELTQRDGSVIPVKITFNGAESPTVTVRTTAETFADIQSGKTSAPMAYMQGKLRMEGDIPFALSLNVFLSG